MSRATAWRGDHQERSQPCPGGWAGRGGCGIRLGQRRVRWGTAGVESQQGGSARPARSRQCRRSDAVTEDPGWRRRVGPWDGVLTRGVLGAPGSRRQPVDAEGPKNTDGIMGQVTSEDARGRPGSEGSKVKRSETDACQPGRHRWL